MSKSNYMPRRDEDRVVWLNNFSSKFSAVAAGLGFTPAEVTSVKNDAAMFSYLVNAADAFTKAKEQRVNYKNLIKDGPVGSPAGTAPVVPNLGTPPATVAPGIFPRIAQLVARIKTQPSYAEAIGKDLGIIGGQQSLNPSEMKPALKLVFKGGYVEVQWKKSDADALRIETDRGEGKWELLAIDTVPHYTDTTPVTAPGNWRYRAMYIINDEHVGQWSDVASISVG